MTDGAKCRFMKMGQEIALAHHERWDGKGYPNGTSGTDIPLAARIVSVADVYDALTSARSYKAAFPHEEALRLIIDSAGTQFDPLVVEAFAAIERMVDQIRQREADPEDIAGSIRPAA
jgi:response regulator RpfG family c-di-GMP phosphodiesterase